MIDDESSSVTSFPARSPAVRFQSTARRSAGSRPSTHPKRRRHYKYWRRHTPHYYIVLTAIALAVTVCVLETLAYQDHSVLLGEVAFGAVAVTVLVVSLAFFWGFFMVMNGNIPAHRIKYLIPHGAVGVLSPLVYTLNVCLGLDGLGDRPVTIWSPICGFACLVLLGIQFSMGKAVVHREPLHIVPKLEAS